ncbi:MAG: inositol monophosphatase [Candidatus Peribacteraceae bacterium]|nr:inositol monophosphatase [Candidatus Peribacteraceae bacterium]
MNKAPFDLRQALDVARRAAEAGADIAMRKRKGGSALQIRSKRRADFVTDVDQAAQEAVIREIRSVFPAHRILAEEEGSDGLSNPDSPFRWIIDPLDGTTPYIHGKDDFGTIVALEQEGEIVVGMMVLPAKNLTFSGSRGGGVSVNGEPVLLRPTESMDDAILCTNTIQNYEENPVTLRFPKCAGLQNYGCAAMEFGEILLGHNDGLFFNGPHLWDAAAGCFLVREAGGRAKLELKDLSDQRGGVLCVATTKPIFGELEQFVFGKH